MKGVTIICFGEAEHTKSYGKEIHFGSQRYVCTDVKLLFYQVF